MGYLKKTIKNIIFKNRTDNSKIGENSNIYYKTKLYNSVLEGANNIGVGCVVTNTYIGYATYLAGNNYFASSKIGKYCSIAEGVKTMIGEHPTRNWVSTHPAFFSLLNQSGVIYTKENKFKEKRMADNDYNVVIGNDVWLASNVTIIDGVTIGDGAIVCAGAVVTENVPPYAMVGGVPAKVIRYRFSVEDIIWLQELKWWDKTECWIRKYAEFFEDIDKLRLELKSSESVKDVF